MNGWIIALTIGLLLANACMGAFLVSQSGTWSEWLAWDAIEQLGRMAWLVCGGLGVYVGVLLALGLRWRDVYR